MRNRDEQEDRDIRNHIHAIKSSLQSLLVANEMVMEDRKLGRKNDSLLKNMLGDIKRINDVVESIEKEFGGEEL